jgi:Xaa-Pro aminopeptidase
VSAPPLPGDRRADIEAKQAQVVALLAGLDCEALLILEPENFAWLTAGATARGVVDEQQLPGLYVSADVRALLVSNIDSQRFFDEELDGLGFQLKEWSWAAGREQLLSYLTRGRRMASDVLRSDCKPAGEELRRLRRVITDFDMPTYKQLGHILAHALEATCRTVALKETEQEIAGHLSHRVLKHGAELVSVEVAADDRLRQYRRSGYTPLPVTKHCVITGTASMNGLYATASRSVAFGNTDAEFRRGHDAATKVTASYIAASWPDAVPSALLQGGRRVYQINQYEHEWRLGPAGWLTGHGAVEHLLTPQTTENLQASWAVTWQASCGTACSCDTFVITPKGPIIITSPGNWPRKRIRISGANFDRPDILQRT